MGEKIEKDIDGCTSYCPICCRKCIWGLDHDGYHECSQSQHPKWQDIALSK